jgi:sarcosine oxidase subunit beta
VLWGETLSAKPRVVVIGAGAIGLAVALELRRADIADVTVVERNPSPGLGSTGRANGGVRAQFTSPLNILFSQWTIAALAQLDQATQGQVGYRAVGYLFLAGTDATAAALRGGYEMQRSLRVPVEWMSAAQVATLTPFVRLDGMRAASFCPTDGVIDPHGVVMALAAEGRRLGVTFMFGTAIDGLEAHGRGAVLHTDGATIPADHVVNAAGAEARTVAAMAGVDIPVGPYRRNLACTEAIHDIAASIPMCVDMDTGVLIRREGDGVLIAYSDPASPPCHDTTFEPEFLDAVASRVANRFPFLADATINPRKCWAGLYPETPDHNAIIGSTAEMPWFIQCAGFGGHGIMHCLAAGRAVAELVRDERCSSFDLRSFAVNRFQDADLAVESAIL